MENLTYFVGVISDQVTSVGFYPSIEFFNLKLNPNLIFESVFDSLRVNVLFYNQEYLTLTETLQGFQHIINTSIANTDLQNNLQEIYNNMNSYEGHTMHDCRISTENISPTRLIKAIRPCR
jgi:hypothetical protein